MRMSSKTFKVHSFHVKHRHPPNRNIITCNENFVDATPKEELKNKPQNTKNNLAEVQNRYFISIL